MSEAGPPRRVTYLVMSTHLGGAATSFALLLESLAGRGIERRVLLLGEPWPGALRARIERSCEDLRVLPVPHLYHDVGYWTPPWRWRRVLRQSRAGVRELLAELRAHPPEVLHLNTTIYSHLLGPLKAALPGTPLVVHARELLRERAPGDPVAAWIRRQTLLHADLLVAISENELRPLPDHPRAVVLPNPVDLAAIPTAGTGRLRAQLRLPAGRLLVGMIASFLPMKGHLDLLRAARRVLDEGRYDAHFALIGFPARAAWRRGVGRALAPFALSYSGQVERAVAQLGLREQVSLLPPTDRPLEALCDLDVVVRPSLAGDPWGRDVIEAMACARPVVATGASQVYLREGETGFLVAPGQPAALADRVGRLLADPRLRAAMGARGRQVVSELCDLRDYGDRLLALYARLPRRVG